MGKGGFFSSRPCVFLQREKILAGALEIAGDNKSGASLKTSGLICIVLSEHKPSFFVISVN